MRWLKARFVRSRRDDELSALIRDHLDEKAADLVDRGMTREEAERAARLQFGNVTRIEERSRAVWHSGAFASIVADLGLASRRLLNNPGFTITVIAVLALGIAASVSIFAFVNAALLSPLPYQNGSRLVSVFAKTASCADCGLSYPDFDELKRSNSVFSSFDVWEANAYLWRSTAGVEALRAGTVSAGFFQTLGVTPFLGRLFTPRDDGPSAARSVVLPYRTWERFFGGRTDVRGQSVTLDDNRYTVIGVLPRNFEFAPRAAELWVT